MPELAGEILTGAGALAGLIVVVWWVTQRVINHTLNKRLESYRSSLQEEKRLFELRLERQAFEYQTKYASLHADRATAIIAIWRALKYAVAYTNGFVHPAQFGGKEAQDKRGEEAAAKIQSLSNLVFENTIYFQKELADKLLNFAKDLDAEFFVTYEDYRDARESGENPHYEGQPGAGRSTFGEAWKVLRERVVPLQTDLETEFRDLLGVEDSVRPADSKAVQ